MSSLTQKTPFFSYLALKDDTTTKKPSSGLHGHEI